MNYDNIVIAVFTLYQVGTAQGWASAMFEALDATGVDLQPKQGRNYILTIYFLVFTIVFKLFLMSIYTATLSKSYMEFRNERMGYNRLTPAQKEWVVIKRTILSLEPNVEFQPSEGFRRRVYLLINHPRYKRAKSVIIFLNTLCLSVIYHRMNKPTHITLNTLNLVFSFCFFFDNCLKLII